MTRHEILSKTLVLLDRGNTAVDDLVGGLESLNVPISRIDFARLDEMGANVRDRTTEASRDFLLFSENDQVRRRGDIGGAIRRLRSGYSSFSGIDNEMWEEQTRRCLEDFLSGDVELNLPPGRKISAAEGSGRPGLSLVFDTEQLGGVRFGLPRILKVLEEFEAPATFFVTGFIASTYPGLLSDLTRRGHSVGIHGAYHEYFSDMAPSAQTARIGDEKAAFEKSAPVTGANFFLRMNSDTVRSMVRAGLKYFLVSMEYVYRPFSYRWMPAGPLPVWTPDGSIWMVPVSVESYNRPSVVVACTLDAALAQAEMERSPAVTTLMHPFRDGSLRHIDGLRKLLSHCLYHRRLSPTTVDGVIARLETQEPTVYIHVDVGDGDMNNNNIIRDKDHVRRQMRSLPLFWQRVGRLFLDLKEIGEEPALCLDCPDNAPVFAVHPVIPEAPDRICTVEADPLATGRGGRKYLSVLSECLQVKGNPLFLLDPGVSAITLPVDWPHTGGDWRGLVPEFAVRAASRIAGSRSLF